MTFEEYQRQAESFKTPSSNNLEYLTLGLVGELGEAAGKLAKKIRDDKFDKEAFAQELGDILWFLANLTQRGSGITWKSIMSVGGTREDDYVDKKMPEIFMTFAQKITNIASLAKYLYWFNYQNALYGLARVAAEYGYTLEQLAELNIAKLSSRKARGVIKGNGDER